MAEQPETVGRQYSRSASGLSVYREACQLRIAQNPRNKDIAARLDFASKDDCVGHT